MTEIIVMIGEEGNTETLIKNTLEDLLHDFQFFLSEAKKHPADAPESMFLHKRFLRAALLLLFAYLEGVTNSWVSTALEKRDLGFIFKRLQYDCLEKKVELLSGLGLAATRKPDVLEAKQVRNLLVHFTPGRDGEAFDRLSLPLVEEVAGELELWMSEMESSLGLLRHADSDQVLQEFGSALGTPVNEVSSSPGG